MCVCVCVCVRYAYLEDTALRLYSGVSGDSCIVHIATKLGYVKQDSNCLQTVRPGFDSW